MPNARVYAARAIVLRRTNLGETDKIVTLLTRERGKLNAVAKGARRPSSRLAGATELFGLCHVLLACGRSLDVLTQVDVREAFASLRGNLNRIAAASYLCELADHFTEERHPNAEVFDLLLAGLYVVSALDDMALVVAGYTLQLLAASGYAPELEACARCRKEDEAFRAFSPALGGVVCRACRPMVKDAMWLEAGTVALMRRLLGTDLGVAVRAEPSPVVRGQLLKAVRRFLDYRSDRPIVSARFLDELMAVRFVEENVA
jgi:DNA repair protein RecO (recombination protein O)